ncbi:MAG: hypothetical protein ABSH33_10425 [Steroidobacteraceae bacterium]|jgi:hypothetical protein
MHYSPGLMLACSALFAASATAQQEGVKLIGRWLAPESAATATYAGSTVILSFKHSSTVSADLKVSKSKGSQDLFISVSVDGGKPLRMGLARGEHPRVLLASGLSGGPHLVAIRKEGEPAFGALQFSKPTLEVAGRWLPISDDRPIIEVIGDSDATGICALGPDSPEDAVNIWNAQWASEAVSWVGLLEAQLAAVGHPADMVDLAISGSKTASEAESYDLTAPGYSEAVFGEYSPPGRRHASLVLMWGGGNDRHGGGDVATGGGALTYAALSAFQKGVYDQLTKVFARNPDVRAVLLDYIDPTLPDWKPAYDQVLSLFSGAERERIFFLRVQVPQGRQDACEMDPNGHPNVSLHSTWAAQILSWMLSPDIFPRLGFPNGRDWGGL